jgi:hypothetical protein
MNVLVVAAFLLAAMVSGTSLYVKLRPPEMSSTGVAWLRRGLKLGMISSVSVLVLYLVMLYRPPVSPSIFWPITLCAIAGNILNLVSLVCCLRELSVEGVFGALLVLLNQFLWVLYALRAMTVDF